MKVVLFCGGLGMHMREASPKPMVPISYRPILWHVLIHYAHFCAQGFHFVPEVRGTRLPVCRLRYALFLEISLD